MKISHTNYRLLWNLISLPIGVFGVVVIYGFVWYFLYSPPISPITGKADDNPAIGILAGLGFIFLAFVILVWWTWKIIRDNIVYKNDRKFIVINFLILLSYYSLVYFILFF